MVRLVTNKDVTNSEIIKIRTARTESAPDHNDNLMFKILKAHNLTMEYEHKTQRSKQAFQNNITRNYWIKT